MLKLGILGLGEGRSTMSAALNSSKWTLHKVCDLKEELCRQRAKEFDFHEWTNRYEDMLEDAEIDIIGIYTPDKFHASHIKMALEAGKHVVCTKPLIDDLSKAQELLDISEKTGKAENRRKLRRLLILFERIKKTAQISFFLQNKCIFVT
jgi:predicted dehydrogenase